MHCPQELRWIGLRLAKVPTGASAAANNNRLSGTKPLSSPYGKEGGIFVK